ncbi:hypothetical protein GGS20DRAFT_583004 [Poronia punctata]|nr:hypothetical protein GGS20DRAFT_583004 [Poronia punctata]
MAPLQNGTPKIEIAYEICSVDQTNHDRVLRFWTDLTSSLGWDRHAQDSHVHLESATEENWFVVIPQKAPSGEPVSEVGSPQGSIIACHFDNGTGWIGFFVMAEEFRGYGLGGKLFQAAMDSFHAKGIEYIGLDGVPEQRETYGRRGFVETNLISVCSRPHLDNIPPPPAGGLAHGEELISWIGALSPIDMTRSDLEYCGLERSRLWKKQAESQYHAKGLALIGGDKTSKGWVLLRKSIHGYRIGPLYAESRNTASVLLRAIMDSVAEEERSSHPVVAEVWRSNEHAVALFEEYGFETAGTYHRMWYKGKVPPAQAPGGKADQAMYAIYDAVEG